MRHVRDTDFLRKRALFRSELTRFGPAPKALSEFSPPAGASEVRYPSGDFEFRAFLQFPESRHSGKHRGVVFFHGGCGIDEQHFPCTTHFLEAGFVVFSPTMRGENGNPGNYELFLGEVDDARAAIAWLQSQPFVDAEHIYTFGWSMGGEISAILSLFGDPGVRLTGSVGPFFPRTERFGENSMYGAPAPFDIRDENEQAMRTLAGHLEDMQIPHYAYIGTEDEQFSDGAYRQIPPRRSILEIIEVPGDHDSSVHPAVKHFIRVIEKI